jgi:hypothetical protein
LYDEHQRFDAANLLNLVIDVIANQEFDRLCYRQEKSEKALSRSTFAGLFAFPTPTRL